MDENQHFVILGMLKHTRPGIVKFCIFDKLILCMKRRMRTFLALFERKYSVNMWDKHDFFHVPKTLTNLKVDVCNMD